MFGCNVLLCNGSEEQNIVYCTKEASRIIGPFEGGQRTAQGKRKDIEIVRDMIGEGHGMRTIAPACRSFQAIRGAELLLKYMEIGRSWETEVRWYHGSTGGGKTKAMQEEFPHAWWSQKNLQWWEAYDAHEVVFIDDFRKDFCTFHELLRILDRYPYRVMTKGGSRQLLAKVIIISCPWDPQTLYQSRSAEDIGQLMRRITKVQQFGEFVDLAVSPADTQHSSAPNFRRN